MYKKARWLVREAILRTKYMMSDSCLFCKLVAGEIKTDRVIETGRVVAVNDLNPVAETHIVIIPKKQIDSVLSVSASDADDIIAMFEVAQKIIAQKKLSAFRLAFNGGSYQHVSHLHMHLISGGSIKWNKL